MLDERLLSRRFRLRCRQAGEEPTSCATRAGFASDPQPHEIGDWPTDFLPAGEVDVWSVALDQPGSGVEALDGLLSADERQRAGRCRLEVDRRRSVVARGGLRILLAHYLRALPSEVQVALGPWGKPAIDAASRQREPLEFSVGRRGASCLIAVARNRAVGIDVEEVDRSIDPVKLAPMVLSPAETAALLGAPEAGRIDLFYRYWTLKEALAKARGRGLAMALDRITIPLEDDRTIIPMELEGEKTHWLLIEWAHAQEVVAALAVNDPRPAPTVEGA